MALAMGNAPATVYTNDALMKLRVIKTQAK